MMNHHSDLTLILFCDGELSADTVEEYKSVCRQLIIIHTGQDSAYPTNGESLVLQGMSNTVNILNQAVEQATGSHILWLEEGESIPEIPDLVNNTYYAARIEQTDGDNRAFNRQVRLFPHPSCSTPGFQGIEIPDICFTADSLNWQLSGRELIIQKPGQPYPPPIIEQEVKEGGDAPSHSFWKAIWASGNDDFGRAIRYFKKALKNNSAPSWNRLAALNGLANALMETHQLKEAKKYVDQSLQQTQNQRAPYLTLHQYHNLKGEHEEAYQALNRYREVIDTPSDANWDVYLPESQATFLMAEIAYRVGWHERAYLHYEQFYGQHNGQVSQEVKEKLIVYAVELGHRERAKYFFDTLFGNKIPHNLDDEQSARISEALSLFTDKGWYEFPSSMYQKLIEYRPDDKVLRHGCIRTLIKNNEIKKAQTLL